MKSYVKLFDIIGAKNHERLDITNMLSAAAESAGISDGLVLVRCMHTSMLLFIEDNDSRRLEYDGNSITLSLTAGKLDLGFWEKIVVDNYNAKKEKHIMMKIIGE